MTRARREGLLALGSNLSPELHVPNALTWIRRRFEVVAVSPLYRCPPVGARDPQPDYVNLAVRIRTDLPPRALRETCRRVEDVCGRQRQPDRYAARTMDVDIALLDDLVLDLDTWRLPDPQLETQAFVIVPCADVWPEAVHPVRHQTLRELCDALPEPDRAQLICIEHDAFPATAAGGERTD